MTRLHPRRSRRDGERGAALVEFALAIPIFLVLIALIFDTGLGFAASRSSSSAARSAARVGALAGEDRYADFQILEAIKAKYDGSGDSVQQITVYVSEPGSDGTVPEPCKLLGGSTAGLCNVYQGSLLPTLSKSSFISDLDAEGEEVCASGSIDSAWCPTDRRADDGKYLGVAIWTKHGATVGLGPSEFDLEDRAVFALYFPPLPVTPTP